MTARCLPVLLLVATLWADPIGAVRAADTIQFNRDVRPILADKCFTCHGPDKNKREADLRLDTGEGAFEKRDEHATLVPGKPDESELVRRILSTDPEEHMPPASTQKSVSPEQLATLRKWIEEGAKFEPHWALVPPQKAAVPDAGQGWAANEIDRFIAATHAQHGLAPSPDVERRILARRLSFDLLGLPPTPQEVAAFVQDPSDQAYESYVDRLLASPHYGERMGQYWLDVVRYADSAGYHSDNERDLSPYRDYVIAAFNQNMPFDQFSLEQIAGDLLPNATTQQRIASGYNRLLQTTEEGGAQPKEYTVKYQADRVRNTAVAWLAITMGCCECHSHKYDSFTIQDFYQLAAFFADVQEKAVGRQDPVALPTPEQEKEIAELDQRLRPLRAVYEQDTPELQASQARWEDTIRADLTHGKSDWKILKLEQVAAKNGSTLTVQDDLSVLASGENPKQEDYVATFTTGPNAVTGLRLETLTHDSLAQKSLSRGNGNFVLSEVEVKVQPAGAEKFEPAKIASAEADFSQPNHPIAQAIDGKSDTGWAVAGHERSADHRAVFVLEKPIPPGSRVELTLRHASKFDQHHIGRFRLAESAAAKPSVSEVPGLSFDLVAVLKQPAGSERTAEQAAGLRSFYRTVAPELNEVRTQIAALEQRRAQLEQAFPKTLVSMSAAPRTVRVLPRGNWLDESGEEVQPATPAVLPPARYENRQQARLELGKWLGRRDHPLTARVFVNRVWKLMFGQGIVRTLDDLGVQGAPPTHPELLDWLAVDFMENGWNVKRLVKQMVMSRTYRQTSQLTPMLRDKDPNNQWLARQSAFRLDAEFVRDNALAVSGLLSRKVGGRSVKPYQPAGYWRYLNFPTREWQNDHGDDLYRRGLYTHWQRTFLHPSLLAFDAPSREECTVDRPRSNTPLQALALLNDPTYVEAARALAMRIVESKPSAPRDGLELAFQRVLQRSPTDAETAVLLPLYEKHRAAYESDPSSAAALLKVGESPLPDGFAVVDLAAWSSVCRAMLNLHETITRY